jgi:predicted permease
MNFERTHRMTELFGRLAPGVSLESARAELTAIHASIVRAHPEAYAARASVQLQVATLRDQIVAPARTILLVLLVSAGIVFLIACSNVANLILARSVRREGELAVRAALGASHGALRRTLLAESVVLCGAGAVLGVLLADRFVAVVARFAARFSVRALEVRADATLLWVGVCLAMLAAVLLAYIPRLPSLQAPNGLGLASGPHSRPGTNRRLRVFATTQIALSFMLLAGAATLLSALVALQTARTGYHYDVGQVLAVDIPEPGPGIPRPNGVVYEEMLRRIGTLPGVKAVATGTFVPWRDAGRWPRLQFSGEGYSPADGEENPHARPRWVSPGFFAILGVPLLAGRDFTDADQTSDEQVVVVSESVARRLFPSGEALNHKLWWTEQRLGPTPRRIVGVVADVDDENVVPGPASTIYGLADLRSNMPGRLFIHAERDAYALVPTITRVIREMLADQPVERASTLEDVRAEVLAPERLNTFVISGFAAVALLIAVVGVAGVLAFRVSTRMRELGMRMALGATPRRVLMLVLSEGALIVATGIVTGGACIHAFAGVARAFVGNVHVPGALPLLGAAAVLACAGILASLLPAARASHVDVVLALRSE